MSQEFLANALGSEYPFVHQSHPSAVSVILVMEEPSKPRNTI